MKLIRKKPTSVTDHQIRSLDIQRARGDFPPTSTIKILGEIVYLTTIAIVLFVGCQTSFLLAVLRFTVGLSCDKTWKSAHRWLEALLLRLTLGPVVFLLQWWNGCKFWLTFHDMELLKIIREEEFTNLFIIDEAKGVQLALLLLLAPLVTDFTGLRFLWARSLTCASPLSWLFAPIENNLALSDTTDQGKFKSHLDCLQENYDRLSVFMMVPCESTTTNASQTRDSLTHNVMSSQMAIVRHYIAQNKLEAGQIRPVRLFNLSLFASQRHSPEDFFNGQRIRPYVHLKQIDIESVTKEDILNSKDTCPALRDLLLDSIKERRCISEHFEKNSGITGISGEEGHTYLVTSDACHLIDWLLGGIYLLSSLIYLTQVVFPDSLIIRLILLIYGACCLILTASIKDQESIQTEAQSSEQSFDD